MTKKERQILTRWQKEVELSLFESKALCMALFSIKDKQLLFSNPAFQLLARSSDADTLRNPAFDKLASMAKNHESEHSPVFEGLMTIGPENDSTTIQGKVYCRDNELLVSGEIDLVRINNQHRHMVSLNHEISNLQRQLTKEKVLLESALEELQETNEKLAILNEEKNRFMNMAAHDLRSPIATAISFTDILLHDEEDFPEETRKEFLKNIEERLNFSIQLMTELLDVSKIEAGTLTLNLQTNDYIALVKQSVGFNQLVADYKDMTIRSSFHEDSLAFVFDRNKMEQVLNNLISNAIKFSHHGSEIQVRVRRHPDHVETSVIDQGLGIAEDEIPILFKPFQKTSTLPTGGEKSTGLGLAICKKIVEEHKGEITVNSVKGEGSEFTFTIPLFIPANS